MAPRGNVDRKRDSGEPDTDDRQRHSLIGVVLWWRRRTRRRRRWRHVGRGLRGGAGQPDCARRADHAQREPACLGCLRRCGGRRTCGDSSSRIENKSCSNGGRCNPRPQDTHSKFSLLGAHYSNAANRAMLPRLRFSTAHGYHIDNRSDNNASPIEFRRGCVGNKEIANRCVSASVGGNSEG